VWVAIAVEGVDIVVVVVMVVVVKRSVGRAASSEGTSGTTVWGAGEGRREREADEEVRRVDWRV
jgi:hypothetical protein